MAAEAITAEEVRDALACVLSARRVTEGPLIELRAVTERLRERPADLEARSWALHELLLHLTRSQLLKLRARARPEAGQRASDADDPERELPRDFEAGSSDLEAWACLYYRYLAPMPLQVKEIAAIVQPRSAHGRKLITRRLARGYTLLADALRSHEARLAEQRGIRADEPRPDATTRISTGEAVSKDSGLPSPATRIIGRESELEALREALDRSRVLTLVGSGGVGKTRLAIELARCLRERFAQGVCLIELSQLGEPELLAWSLVDALQVEVEAGRSAEDALIAAVADRELLILLDNCESLLEATARLVRRLVEAAPGLRILSTSRSPLGLQAEQLWQVAPLAVPPADGSLVTDAHSVHASVDLFVDRARMVRPDFSLTRDNRLAVEGICRRLDGLPLAIELAAARVRLLSPEQILDRLDDRLALLTGPKQRAELAHHQTLRAAIDWSYAMLRDRERVLLRRLSVFRGGWTLEAAEGIVAGEAVEAAEVLDGLDRLAGHSLIWVEPRGAAVRYHVLDTIRAFGWQALQADGESAVVCLRHAEWYLAVAEQAAEALEGPKQGAWLQRLSEEIENLREASARLEARPGSGPRAMRMAAALSGFWQMQGHLEEGLQRLERVLALPGNEIPSVDRARALVGAGELAFRLGGLERARIHLEGSIEIWRELGDRVGEAQALRRLGNLLDVQGDYEAARGAHVSALATWRAVGDAWGIAATLNNLGLVCRKQGDQAGARDYLERSLAGFEALGTVWAIAVTHANLGDIALDLCEVDGAERHYRQSLSIARGLSDAEGVAYALEGLANVARRRRDFAAAWGFLAESLTGLAAIHARLEIADWIESAVQLAVDERKPGLAARLWGAAERLRSEIEAPTPNSVAPALAAAEVSMREALGDPAFEAGRAEGRRLGWERLTESILAGR